MKKIINHHCKTNGCPYTSKYLITLQRHQRRCQKRLKRQVQKIKRLSSTKSKSNGKKKTPKNPFKKIDLNTLKVKDCIGRGKYGVIFRGAVGINKIKYPFICKISHQSHIDEHKMEKKVYNLLQKKYLNNQNFLKYYGSLSIRGGNALILESLSSITLQDFFRKTRYSRLDIKSFYAIKLWRKLLQTFKDLHEVGIVHNDLKPNNIGFRLDQNGNINQDPVLFDFGMSQSFVGKKETDKGQFGTFPVYRSMRTLRQYHQTFPKDQCQTLAYIFMKYLLGMTWQTPQGITNKQKRLRILKAKQTFIYQDLQDSPSLKKYIKLFEYVRYMDNLPQNEKVDYEYLDRLLAQAQNIFSKTVKLGHRGWKSRMKKRALIHKQGNTIFHMHYHPYPVAISQIYFSRFRERQAINSQQAYGSQLKPLHWISYDHMQEERLNSDKNIYMSQMVQLKQKFDRKEPLTFQDIGTYLTKAGFTYTKDFNFLRCQQKDRKKIQQYMVRPDFTLFIVQFVQKGFFATYLSFDTVGGPDIISFDTTRQNYMPLWPRYAGYSNRRFQELQTWKTGYISCYFAQLLLRTGLRFWRQVQQLHPDMNFAYMEETPEIQIPELDAISQRSQGSEQSQQQKSEQIQQQESQRQKSQGKQSQENYDSSFIDELAYLNPNGRF